MKTFWIEVDNIVFIFEAYRAFTTTTTHEGYWAMPIRRPPGVSKAQALDLRDWLQDVYNNVYAKNGEYAELTLAQFLQKMFGRNARDVQPEELGGWTPDKVRQALKPYCDTKMGNSTFNMDKGVPEPEPEHWPSLDRQPLPPLVIGQLRELNKPDGKHPTKFLIKGENLYRYNKPVKPNDTYSLVRVVFVDGDEREYSQQWIEEFSHPL